MELHEHNRMYTLYLLYYMIPNLKYKDLVCNIAFSLANCVLSEGQWAIYRILSPSIACKGILNFGSDLYILWIKD